MSLTILITGANRGIGLEFTKQFVEAGNRVLACCRDPHNATALQKLAIQHKSLISVHQLDIADFAQIDHLAQTLLGTNIDLLINNAGIYPGGKKEGFGHIDYLAWVEAFKINSMAPLKMAEAFVSHLASSQYKKIANLTSKMGSIEDNTSGGSYLYRSSKTALNMALKSLSIDLAPRGIATVILHPGWVQTEMGGPGALITAEQSVNGMRRVIEQLSLRNTGKFYAYDGKEIPW